MDYIGKMLYSLYPDCRTITGNLSNITDIQSDDDCVVLDCVNKIYVGDEIPFTLYEEIIGTKFNPQSKSYKSFLTANSLLIKDKKLIITETKLNESYVYLLPLLNIHKSKLCLDYLYNTYIDTTEYNKGEYFLYLTYRYVPFDVFHVFEALIKTYKGFVYKVDNKDRRFVTFVFKVSYEKEYDKYLSSDFRGWSKEVKKLIKDFHNYNDKSIPMRILNDCSKYRDEMIAKFSTTWDNFGRKCDDKDLVNANLHQLHERIDLNNETLKY